MTSEFAQDWNIRPDTTYLNHGSFGISPRPVRQAHDRWRQSLATQPMDYFIRKYEPAWIAARDRLAEFIGADRESLTLLENSTVAMNVIAQSFPLTPGDEVLLTDHEYGAVTRTWQEACMRAGARVIIGEIPWPLHDPQEIVDSLFAAASPATRLVVFSHITSPTALTLPAAAIATEARARGIAVCIDGPHAVAQLPLNLEWISCDFYTASCHKWLCAPAGSGFLYADRRWHDHLKPLVTSWGRIPPTQPQSWWESFIWRGTRDATPLLSLPEAIDYLEHRVGLDRFRESTHKLARYARTRLLERWCGTTWTEDDRQWYTSMVAVPLPPGDARGLQQRLWRRHGIEIPVVEFQQTRSIRVSCHLYNTRDDIDRLVEALEEELASEPVVQWGVR